MSKAPAIIWCCLAFWHMSNELAKHGEEREGEHNFFLSLIGLVISAGLLNWGGFFDSIK